MANTGPLAFQDADIDNQQTENGSDAATLSAAEQEAVDYSPFHSKLQFFAWIHHLSGDVKRANIPKQLLRDKVGNVNLMDLSDDDRKEALKDMKTIANSVIDFYPLLEPRVFRDISKSQSLAWVGLFPYCPFSVISFFFIF